MDIQPKQETAKRPADLFTGDVWFDVIAKGEEPSRMRVNTVRFSRGARTAWHTHAVGQTLHVTEGRGLVHARGGDIVEIRLGDTIYAPPGEWHWARSGAGPLHDAHRDVGSARRRGRVGLGSTCHRRRVSGAK